MRPAARSELDGVLRNRPANLKLKRRRDSEWAGGTVEREGRGESMRGNDQPEQSYRIRRLEPTEQVVGQRLGDELVLVNLETNRIFELSRTAGRFWELLQSESDVDRIEKQLVEEFEVSAEQVAAEVERLISGLAAEKLVRIREDD